MLSDLYQATQRAVGLAVQAVRQQDVTAAKAVLDMSDEVRGLADTLMTRLAAGLEAAGPQQLASLRLMTWFVHGLRQIFCRHAADPFYYDLFPVLILDGFS